MKNKKRKHNNKALKKKKKKREREEEALGNAQKTKTIDQNHKKSWAEGVRRSNNKGLKQTEKKKKQPASEITWPETVTTGIFIKQVVFLTVNHRRPLPLRELHSTSEIIMWRDPGGSWACLPPVYHNQCNHPATVCNTCGLCPEKAH